MRAFSIPCNHARVGLTFPVSQPSSHRSCALRCETPTTASYSASFGRNSLLLKCNRSKPLSRSRHSWSVKAVQDETTLSDKVGVDWTSEWNRAAQLMKDGETVSSVIEMANRGGVIVRVGKLKGFVPASQLAPSRLPTEDLGGMMLMDKLATLVGEPVQLKVMEVNQEGRQFVLSERAVMKDSSMATLAEGMQTKAIIRNLLDYGAFADLCNEAGERTGAEGLIHLSELSWENVAHPSEVLQMGQEVTVEVIKVDRERSRISLSMRSLQEDPLLETLDTLMPVSETMDDIDFDYEESDGEIELSGLAAICTELEAVEGIERVTAGRRATEAHVVSQDLQIWMTNVEVLDGFNLVARAGRQVQEVHVVTRLSRDEIKSQLRSILSRVP